MIEETIRFTVCAVLAICVLFGTAFLLTGCQSTQDDAKFLECLARDRTANPCN